VTTEGFSLAVVAFNLNGLVDNYQKTVGNSLLGYDLMDRLWPFAAL
jgi:hypothetical protein